MTLLLHILYIFLGLLLTSVMLLFLSTYTLGNISQAQPSSEWDKAAFKMCNY